MSSVSNVTIEQMNDEARIRLVEGLETKGAHVTFEEATADFPGELFNEKHPNVPYTFWHQLEHIRIAQRDMLDYIRDPNYASPEWPGGYWPSQDARTDHAGWKNTIDRYLSDRSEFIELIDDKATNLLAPVDRLGNRSIMRCALIIVAHNGYHLGEFVLGRQILGAWKSMLA